MLVERSEADYEAHTTAANKNRFRAAGHAGKQGGRETLPRHRAGELPEDVPWKLRGRAGGG